MTSHDAVGALRRIFRVRKTGHTGTLDPQACGVLCICMGRATRAAEDLENERKAYRCELTLGLTSDTGDIWGNLTDDHREEAVSVTEEEIRNVLASFQGTQLQYPPAYSAVRVGGKHLYQYARDGEQVEIQPREITVYRIDPVRVLEEPGKVLFDIECSRGTYVRSICEDVGRQLGCGALMSMLVRTASGEMRLQDAVTFEEILSAVSESEGLSPEDIMSARRDGPFREDMSHFLTPVDEMLSSFGTIQLASQEAHKFINGGKISGRVAEVSLWNTEPQNSRFRNIYRIYGPDGTFIGTAVRNPDSGVLTADKVFFR